MGQVNQPSDVNSEIRELKRQVAELTKRVGLSSAVISRGGLRIINEGEFTVLNSADIETFKVGQVEFGAGSSFGMQVNYEDGTRGIVFGGTPGQQVFALCDETGNYIVTNDSASGHGLARPYLNYRMIPSAEAQTFGTSFWPSHTSTSYTRLWQGRNPVSHPKAYIRVLTNTAGGGTAFWRLRINNIDVTGDVSGSAAMIVSVPGWGTDILPYQNIDFEVDARISGGSNVLVSVDGFYGTQS